MRFFIKMERQKLSKVKLRKVKKNKSKTFKMIQIRIMLKYYLNGEQRNRPHTWIFTATNGGLNFPLV